MVFRCWKEWGSYRLALAKPEITAQEGKQDQSKRLYSKENDN